MHFSTQPRRIMSSTSAPKRMPAASCTTEQPCHNKRQRTSLLATCAKPASAAVPFTGMPPMMPPPMMMGPWGMPPPYMAMHACMMMQMHMQQAMAAHAQSGAPAPAPEIKPTEATLAAKALGHPEGLPTYPAIPLPAAPPAFFSMHPAMPALPPKAKVAATKMSAAPKKKCAPAAAPKKSCDVAATDLTDCDFAAFIDSFVSDNVPEVCGKRTSDSDGSSSGGSDASCSDDLNLDDLLPVDAVWDVVKSSAVDVLPSLACDEDDLIFGSMHADVLDAALIL